MFHEPCSASFAELIDQEILEIGDGYRAKLEELGGDGLIFLRAGLVSDQGFDWDSAERFDKEATPRLRPKMGRAGDTIVTTKGNSVGRSGFVTEGAPPFVYSPHLSYWRSLDSGRLSSSYLYYWSRGREFGAQLRALAHGTDMAPYLSLTDQRYLRISLPTVARQNEITSVLVAIDDKIAVNHRILVTSSGLIRALYEKCLAAVTVKLNLNEVVGFDFGAPFSSSHFNEHGRGLPLLRIRDLRTWQPGFWTTERLPGDIVIQPGDVVAGMDGEFRPTFWLGEAALLNQRVLRGRSRMFGGRTSFVREVLREALHEIERFKTGTTVIHLNKRDLDASTVQVPSVGALREFEAAAEPLRIKLVWTARESVLLAETRDALLPKLMSGEIQVREAERVVEDVT